MSGKKYIGITERLIRKSPLSPFTTAIIIFLVIISFAATSAYFVGEFDFFVLDIGVYTVIFGFAILLWGETFVGESARISSEKIAQEFNFQTPVDEFLDGVFNIKARLVVGLVVAAFFLGMYELLGFWYDSIMMITLGRIFACVLGFVVGELIVAAYNLLFGTRNLVIKLYGKIDIFDFDQTSKVEGLATVCFQSASIGGLAGFFALFGMLFAPWRSTRLVAEIPILLIGALLLLCFVIFVVPMNAIHKVLKYAHEEKKSVISKKLVKLYESVVTDNVKTSIKNMEAIHTLKNQIDVTAIWPLDVKKAIGYITPILGVIIETLILVMLGRI